MNALLTNIIYQVDDDRDGYYSKYSFNVKIKAVGGTPITPPWYLPLTVNPKVICTTTGQEWWSASSWTIDAYTVYELTIYGWNEQSFANYVRCNTNLNFRVELWNASKTQVLATDSVIEGAPIKADRTTYFDVQGRVLDAASNSPLAQVTVSVGPRNGLTAADGTFRLTAVPNSGVTTLAAEKAGYATYLRSVELPNDAVLLTTEDIFLTAGATNFAVTAVRPKYDGLFLSGVSFSNQYTASVEWGTNTPDHVEFSVNGTVRETIPTSSPEATASLNMGWDFPGSLTPGANKVEVVAVDSLGERSEPFEQAVTILPTPAFLLSGQTPLPFGWVGGSFPELQFKLSWPPARQASGDLINIPYFDSVTCSFGAETEFTYKILSGEWDFKLGGTTPEWKWGQWQPHLAVALAGSGVASATRGVVVQDVGATVALDAEAPIFKVYIVDLVPGGQVLHVLDVLTIVGVDINSIQLLGVNGIAKLQADLRWNYQTGKYENTTVTPTLGARAYYAPNILGSSLEMSVILGGDFAMRFGRDFAWQLKGEAAFRLRANVWLLLNYDQTFVLLRATLSSPNWAFPNSLTRATMGGGPTGGQMILAVVTESVTPRPMDRYYLDAGPEHFVADDAGVEPLGKRVSSVLNDFRQLSQMRVRGSVMGQNEIRPKDFADMQGTNQVDLTLVANAFPNSQPALAGRSNELMLLYVTDNGSSNDLQFTDIKWTRWDGANWSVPLAIQTNTQAEFAPQVAYDGNGDAIAVWERVADPNFTQTNLTAMAAQMEIVWSRWSRVSGAWSSPEAFTANNVLDHAPLLCGPMSDGSVLAVWTRNNANLLMGTNGAGSQVVWRQWNPASQSWTVEQTLVADLPYRLSQSLAGVSNHAVYAWARDLDGVLTNATDQQVFYCEWTNGAWGPATQLTTDSLGNRNARVAVAPSGNAFLTWQQETNLVLSTNFTPKAVLVRSDSTTAGFSDYAMTIGPAGNLVLLWQEMSENGSDAHYAVFDPVSATWSQDTLLTQDPPLERSFAPVWDNFGNLTVAYNKVQILYTNKTVTLEDGQTITITNVPQPGRVDLVVTKRALVRDLALATGDFSASGNNFLPGDQVTLSAKVRNLGNVAISNVLVAFWDGSPTNGGRLFTNVTLPGWLVGEATNVANALWIVPEPPTNHVLYAVVNPGGLAGESNPTNNMQSVRVGGTDLAVSLVTYSVGTNGAMRVIAQVQNGGAPSATNSVLSIRRADASGALSTNPVLAMASVPLLGPGQLAQVAVDLPPNTQPQGEAFYQLGADETRVTSDVNTNNNVTTFAVDLWVDSDGDGIPDNWMMQYFGHATGQASDLSRAQDDADGDGVNNLAEYLAGTNPRDAHSYLSITGIGLGGTNGVQITWGSASNKLYSLQRAAAVSGGLGFTNITEHILSTPPENVYLDTTASNSPSLFYRVRVE